MNDIAQSAPMPSARIINARAFATDRRVKLRVSLTAPHDDHEIRILRVKYCSGMAQRLRQNFFGLAFAKPLNEELRVVDKQADDGRLPVQAIIPVGAKRYARICAISSTLTCATPSRPRGAPPHWLGRPEWRASCVRVIRLVSQIASWLAMSQNLYAGSGSIFFCSLPKANLERSTRSKPFLNIRPNRVFGTSSPV